MTLAAFPVGSRVRVVGSTEWINDSGTLNAVGTVTAHDDPYLVVTLDGHSHPFSDEGWLLEPDEVEAAS